MGKHLPGHRSSGRARIQRGTPGGGQFAARHRADDPTVTLDADDPSPTILRVTDETGCVGCGHHNTSHGSFTLAGDFAGVGMGACGLDGDCDCDGYA